VAGGRHGASVVAPRLPEPKPVSKGFRMPGRLKSMKPVPVEQPRVKTSRGGEMDRRGEHGVQYAQAPTATAGLQCTHHVGEFSNTNQFMADCDEWGVEGGVGQHTRRTMPSTHQHRASQGQGRARARARTSVENGSDFRAPYQAHHAVLHRAQQRGNRRAVQSASTELCATKWFRLTDKRSKTEHNAPVQC
jgi:hypothetical protein